MCVCVCVCVCAALSLPRAAPPCSLSSAACVSSHVQVVYDDHSFPKAGTAIGFSSSCATAGENDCDAGDIARASASCLAFSVTRPDCMATYSFGQPPSADCVQAFCTSQCFGDAFNLNEDCVVNTRANIDEQSRQTIMQLAPASLLQACPQPDHGTVLPGGGGH